MNMLYRSALAVGLVVSLATVTAAQTPQTPQNPPTTPQQPTPGTAYPGRTVQGPEGILPETPVRDEPWTFSLGVSGSYEGNALFTGPSDDKEFSHSVQASIGRSWRLRRGDASLAGTVTQAFYQDTTSLDGFRYSVAGGLGHAITRRLSWAGGVTLTSGLARDSQVLTDAGAVLPSETEAQTSSGSSTFSYALSPRSNINWSFAASGVGFSSAAFNGGSNVGSAVTYSRSVGMSHTLGTTADYTRTFSDEFNSDVYGIIGLWAFRVGQGWTISANGGIRPYSSEDGGIEVTSTYSAGVTKPLRRNQTIGVTYGKSVGTALGLREGNSLTETVSVSYVVGLHRNISVSFGGSYVNAKDPENPDNSDVGQVATGNLMYRLLPNLSLSVGTSVYGRKADDEGRTTSTSTYLGIFYNTRWR
jgi:hypothetical protein